MEDPVKAKRLRGPDKSDDGVWSAAKMRKVMGQAARSDDGPTENRMRELLRKDVKGFEARIRELESEETGISKLKGELAAARARSAELEGELAELRAERVAETATGRDMGAERARALIDRILAETHEYKRTSCASLYTAKSSA